MAHEQATVPGAMSISQSAFSRLRNHAAWIAATLCLFSLPVACSVGSSSFPVRHLWQAFFSPDALDAALLSADAIAYSAKTIRFIALELRLPRILLSLFVGAGLAVAGTVFQGILRNPLADPFTLGVSSGAAFGAALAISLGATGLMLGFALPLAAFCGALLALAAVLLLGGIGSGLRRETLVFSGIIVSAFLAALLALVKAVDEASVTGIVFWIMGSFQGRGWGDLLLLLPGFFLGGVVAFCLTRELDMLTLGDRAARHLGLNATRMRLLLLLAASAIAACCVAVSGIIGFVGLVIPHVCRLLLGEAHKQLLPVTAWTGALLLVWSDVAARTLLPNGVELPVGVITALIGGPFFCYILKKRPVGGISLPNTPACVLAAAALTEGGIPSDISAQKALASTAGTHKKPPVPLCAVSHLSLRYSKKQPLALTDISFRIEQGDFVGILGPNGSGKSTLLHCLSGIFTPTHGTITLQHGQPHLLAEKCRARMVSLLPQKPEHMPALSVFAIVLMGRYHHTALFGEYAQEDRQKTWQALADTGVTHLAFRSAPSLSGGELQRVLLARSLAQEAPLLLLDEATAGLDPAYQISVLEALARKNAEQGLTVVAALHDLNLAATYCKRLLLVKDGKMLADGPTKEVFTSSLLSTVYETSVSVVTQEHTPPQAVLASTFLAPAKVF